MSQLYQITFKKLADPALASDAKNALQQKLKLSDAQITRFFNGDSVFNPMPLEKAKRQQKLFSSMGISLTAKAVALGSADKTARQQEVDEKIVAALDYITTSLIRLEEKVDELATKQNADNDTIDLDEVTQSSSWGDDLEFEDGDDTPPKRSKFFPYLIATLIGVLLILLGVLIAFPHLSPIQ